MSDMIYRSDAIEAIYKLLWDEPPYSDSDALCREYAKKIVAALPSADADATMTEEVREALMRLTMCARKECGMCKYKDDCDFYFQYIISTENMHTILDALSAKAVQGDAISKQVVSDAILKKISDLNAQGEKAIPIAREFIRFKKFVDGITPIRADTVQSWIPFTRRPMTEEEQKDYPNCTFMFDCELPDDGDEILVSNGRFVWMDVFCNDIDGCYLDGGDDIDEDMAWMPLPDPYKEE